MSGPSPDLDAWHARASLQAGGVIADVLKHLPRHGVLFDIGANTGCVTQAAIQQRDATVYAFEPHPVYAEYCRKHNPAARVRPVALGAKFDTADLYCDEVSNLGWNTMVSARADEDMKPITVNVLPLDTYFELRRPDVVKIDVEGYEWAVIRGGHDTLREWKPVIVVELGWGTSHPHRANVEREMEWLFSIGYERIDYDVDGTQDFTLVPA